jgi:hypothetical protein
MHLACASNRYRMDIQRARKSHLRFDKTRGERGMHEFVCDVPSVDCVSADRRRKKLSNRPIMVVKYVELMGKFSVCDQNRHTDSVLYGWLYRLCKCAVSLALEIFCAKGCRECACRGCCDARGVAENARAAAAALYARESMRHMAWFLAPVACALSAHIWILMPFVVWSRLCRELRQQTP